MQSTFGRQLFHFLVRFRGAGIDPRNEFRAVHFFVAVQINRVDHKKRVFQVGQIIGTHAIDKHPPLQLFGIDIYHHLQQICWVQQPLVPAFFDVARVVGRGVFLVQF